MLTGLDRGWFKIFADAQYSMRLALSERSNLLSRKGNFGILVHDDYWALNYQIYHYRAKRAKHALLGSGTRWFEFHNGNWNNEESAKKKGEEIDRQLLRVDWERYMYAKKKMIEDFSHMWEE
jgi:hypothetical protein